MPTPLLPAELETLAFEVEGVIATVTLHRPEVMNTQALGEGQERFASGGRSPWLLR